MGRPEDSKPHADFIGPEDTVLHSADGVSFHIACAQLLCASGWFRTVFTVPKASDTSDRVGTVHMRLDEDALTLEILLRLCRGLPAGLERIAALPDLERMLQAADTYDMRGATEVLLLLLHAPRMQADTLHLFGLADRYGQADVAERAVQRLLGMRIALDSVARVENAALVRLVAARQHRIERFCTLLAQNDDSGPFAAENNGFCSYCRTQGRRTTLGSTVFAQWMVLVAALQRVYVVRPTVDALGEDEQVQLNLAEWEATICHVLQCRRLLFDWTNIRLRLQHMVDSF